MTILNQSAATLDVSRAGALVRVISPNTTTLTISNAVPANWSCLVYREGAGAVLFAMGAGGVLTQDQAFDRMRARVARHADLHISHQLGRVRDARGKPDLVSA
ncbi:hypothetical protein U1701_18205 [Sphingomonas sp. PB2P19]|uniref:hypothetical protein n=1 Tax=Sphingomonas rhamnosi TaxID=3096156 RepID=UPI002FC788DD